MRLFGRQDEIRRLRDLIGAAGAGQGGALVLRGEVGIGKSTLLGHAREAAGFRIIQTSGSEFETHLPYASLHQLAAPVLDRLADVLPPQRSAMEVAFGLATGTPDPFRIGLATLSLLAAAAQEQPLICLVGDAQWLDPASAGALAFVARRIAAEPVAMFFAVRTPSDPTDLDDLPGLTVEGLSDADARNLLAVKSHVALDDRVRDRIVAEAHGNPSRCGNCPAAGVSRHRIRRRCRPASSAATGPGWTTFRRMRGHC
ncbi:AAA family ATPase [Phytohabitans flavus]|uniref:AAA family ATPase n=1 Tax=Phytohabitans flavus TaxID=1076124 RepID=UPI00362959FE